MGNKISGVLKAGVILAFGLCATSALADDFDACKEQGGHTGEGTRNPGKSDVSVKDAIPNSIYHYEIWYQGGNNSMTYYQDGTFSAEWNGSNDFLARVGLKYNSDKTYQELSPITADYKFTKQSGNASYSYIGIYGWTQEPLSEYYITDDWFGGKPNPGNRVGEVQVDGETYDIYTNTRYNAPSILDHNETFTQYFSVRRNARQCGHIDITAHMKAWEKYGFKGKLYEAKLLVEAGGGATGKIDFNVLRMQDANTIAAEEAAKSSAAEPESSADATPESSAEVLPTSSAEALPTSSADAAPITPGDSTIAIHTAAKFSVTAGEFQVFNMLGKYMGKVLLADGTSLNDAIYAKFGKAQVYMVKKDGLVKPVRVTK
ncbi:MAG: glycoside hydrolase family 11 protein [Fibrobacter sp.]|nr:glycoside hydrolase family 11 protein [Fibrobacter sp.]